MCGEEIRKKSGIDLCTATYIKLVNCRSLHRPNLKCSLINNCIATTEGIKKAGLEKQFIEVWSGLSRTKFATEEIECRIALKDFLLLMKISWSMRKVC